MKSTVGPQAGQKVAFLGDSITESGAGPLGYVTLVAQALEQHGRKIEVIPAGVSGNTSKDMVARFAHDILSKKPDWMTLSCGVNDVAHDGKRVPLFLYQQIITLMVDQAITAGIQVVILTATMIGEDASNSDNQKLNNYNNFLRTLAAQKNLLLADLNAAMQETLTQQKAAIPAFPGNLLTFDGIHMNALGNEMMAIALLKTFGFTDAQLAAAKEAWKKLPYPLTLEIKNEITFGQYVQLRTIAANQGKSVEEMLHEDLGKVVQNHLR